MTLELVREDVFRTRVLTSLLPRPGAEVAGLSAGLSPAQTAAWLSPGLDTRRGVVDARAFQRAARGGYAG